MKKSIIIISTSVPNGIIVVVILSLTSNLESVLEPFGIDDNIVVDIIFYISLVSIFSFTIIVNFILPVLTAIGNKITENFNKNNPFKDWASITCPICGTPKFGIKKSSLHWENSFLCDRCHTVYSVIKEG